MESSTSFYDYEDDLCDLDPSAEELTTQTYVHAIICAFGLIGNVLVIVTYVHYKHAKTTDVYLINVAAADLIFVVALPFIVYNERHDWAMGAAACKVLRSAYSVNLYGGMLLLACVSGDRYVAIVQARRTFGARSRSRLHYSQLVCAAVWAFAAALTVPTLIFAERTESASPGAARAAWTCQLSFTTDDTAKLMKVLVPGLQMAIGFLLPLVVMACCYASIVRTLLRTHSGQRRRAVRVAMAVVLVFVACHLPYNVTLLVHTLSLFKERSCAAERLRLRVLNVSRDVAYLHCCLNPVLYAFIGVKFRRHLKQVLNVSFSA